MDVSSIAECINISLMKTLMWASSMLQGYVSFQIETAQKLARQWELHDIQVVKEKTTFTLQMSTRFW